MEEQIVFFFLFLEGTRDFRQLKLAVIGGDGAEDDQSHMREALADGAGGGHRAAHNVIIRNNKEFAYKALNHKETLHKFLIF